MLIEPYRQSDRDEVAGLPEDARRPRQVLPGVLHATATSATTSVWDNWRLEGPSFVWYFRGAPHVHVWVNVADDPSVPTNT